ncbi:MAG: tetratricopeptide repeat protein [Candidatus Thiodiazotropha sp. (ex Dulcina madagascariensis)]|nr:tetratricopeptide repeat protein [Candidatus Thiodiazotropha sp. (ex Dulcina madagascariensis)]
MDERRKTCFVISPIGADGTEIRKMADDFLELLIEPALQPFGFDIIRADKITASSVITSDVIRYVQNSDLCIIDLTTHNPNVFYECGRRHENGQPFIQLIQKGDDLPFDVSGIRTINFDISTPRSTLQSIHEIQAYIKNLEEHSYETAATGESLSSVAEGIRRIERRLIHIETQGLSGGQNLGRVSPNIKDILTQHPIGAFNDAYESGNLELAVQLLPRIKRLIGVKEWIQGANNLALVGEPAGEEAILEGLQEPDNIDHDLMVLCLYSLRQYYFNRNLNQQGLQILRELIQDLFDKVIVTDQQKADIINQLALFQISISDNEGAIKSALEAVKLNRSGINLANVASCYSRLNRFDEAAVYVDEFMQLPDLTDVSLETAIEVYSNLGRTEEAGKANEKLLEIREIEK